MSALSDYHITHCWFIDINIDAGEVGLTVTYSMMLMGLFQWMIRQSTEVENLMTSVERVSIILSSVTTITHPMFCPTIDTIAYPGLVQLLFRIEYFGPDTLAFYVSVTNTQYSQRKEQIRS